jgi:thymidylate kinase
MLADKVDAAAHIRARGEDGEHVVADRWWQSALIYGAADELDPDWLRRLGQGLPQADLNILVDISFEESMRRRPERRDRYERDVEKQKKIVSAYREMWKSARRSDWAIVDGAESEVAVAESIWALVARRLIGGA